jgi:hypothetical protein
MAVRTAEWLIGGQKKVILTPEKVTEIRRRLERKIKMFRGRLYLAKSELKELQERCPHSKVVKVMEQGKEIVLCSACLWQETSGD